MNASITTSDRFFFASDLADRIATLNHGELFLPASFLYNTVLVYIATSAIALFAVYSLSFVVAGFLLPKDAPLKQRRKVCYQMTNFAANSFLAIAGNYFFWKTEREGVSVQEKIQGHEEVIILSCFQIGYQVWAIPVGIFHVNESAAMLAHHVTVIWVSIMSGFFRNGFRYSTPFFYGVIETSSIPLSVMNFFKDNREYAKKYSDLFGLTRLVFAFSFLICRIFMFIPRMSEYLYQHYLLFSAHPSILYRIFMSAVWLSSFFLQVLQIYWASLIVKGLVKTLVKSNKKVKQI